MRFYVYKLSDATFYTIDNSLGCNKLSDATFYTIDNRLGCSC
jgi:hypothetical protein